VAAAEEANKGAVGRLALARKFFKRLHHLAAWHCPAFLLKVGGAPGHGDSLAMHLCSAASKKQPKVCSLAMLSIAAAVEAA
jgi:hypothetical protein